MNPVQEVCVDASVAVKVGVTEPDSDKADALFHEWANKGMQLIAPAFFAAETDSILRQKVMLRKELTPEQAESAFAKLQALPIQQIAMPGQRQRACEMAVDSKFPSLVGGFSVCLKCVGHPGGISRYLRLPSTFTHFLMPILWMSFPIIRFRFPYSRWSMATWAKLATTSFTPVGNEADLV